MIWKKKEIQLSLNDHILENTKENLITHKINQQMIDVDNSKVVVPFTINALSSIPKNDTKKKIECSFNDNTLEISSKENVIDHEITPEIFEFPKSLNLSVLNRNETLPIKSRNVDSLPIDIEKL